jgi:DNA repair protein RadC
VTEVAEGLLRAAGGLAGLSLAAELELRDQAGIGPVRAAVVMAALELGRRAAAARPARGQRLAGASDVWTYFRARLAPLRVEEFWAVALDVRHRVQGELCVARGSLTGVEVHPRDVFRPLIRAAAAAVIFCHNHPSGDPTPSRQDIELTGRLREVGELCGIPVVDHVVVGWEGYASLAERNWR